MLGVLLETAHSPKATVVYGSLRAGEGQGAELSPALHSVTHAGEPATVEVWTACKSAHTTNPGWYFCGDSAVNHLPAHHQAGLTTGQDKAGWPRSGLLSCSADCSWAPRKYSTNIGPCYPHSTCRGRGNVSTYATSCFFPSLEFKEH